MRHIVNIYQVMRKNLLLSAALVASVGVASALVVPEARQAVSNLEVVKVDKPVTAVKQVKANKVEKTLTTKSGLKVNLVRDAQGRLHKVIGNGIAPTKNLAVKKTAPIRLKAASDATFFEGFEGYDGETADWVPADWQDVSKNDPAHVYDENADQNLTWRVEGDSYFNSAYEGEYYAYISVAYPDYVTTFTGESQDEWLISPSITPKDGDYLSFYLSYSPAFTLINLNSEYPYSFDAKNSSLAVMISTDGGENWTSVWDVSDEAKKLTEDELWDDASSWSRPYYPFLISLKEYAGKQIKLAFRYYGDNGESMCLDNVTVGEVTPVAKVTSPDAVFSIGFAKEGYMLNNNKTVQLAPYKTPLTWTNSSELYESAAWTYVDPEDETTENTVESVNFDAPAYGFTQVAPPSLVTTIGAQQSEAVTTADAVQYGGSVMASTGTSYVTFDPAMYNYADYIAGKAGFTTVSGGCYSMGAEANATWSGENMLGADCTVNGLGFYVPQPASPYTLSSVWFDIYNETLSAQSTLKAEVYKVTSDGFEKVAGGTAEVTASVSGQSFGMAVVELEKQVGELTETSPLYVDYPILVKLTADLAEGDSFDFVISYNSTEDYDCESYIILQKTDSESESFYYLDVLALGDEGQYHPCGISGGIGASYAWLRSDEDSYGAPAAGGSKSFALDSYYYLYSSGEANFEIQTLEDGYKGDDAENGWYDVVISEDEELTITVDALPDGVDVRSSSFKVVINGVEKTYWVAQRSEASVATLTGAAKASAKVEAGNFVVESGDATSVAVYNVSGQKVAEKSFSGKATIDASGLSHGVYFLKFNNNAVVKVAK